MGDRHTASIGVARVVGLERRGVSLVMRSTRPDVARDRRLRPFDGVVIPSHAIDATFSRWRVVVRVSRL